MWIISGEILSSVGTWVYQHHVAEYYSDVLAFLVDRHPGQLPRPSLILAQTAFRT